MANIYDHKPRNCKRIDYVLKICGQRIPRTKYAPDDAEARILQRQVEAVESAVRTGIAAIDDIEEWIDKKWIKPQEAEDAFRGFKESLHRKQRHDTQATDYDLLEQECLKYAADVTSGSGAEIRNYQNYRSQFRAVLGWLRLHFPRLQDIAIDDVEAFKAALEGEFAPWTVFHRLTKLRIIFDVAHRLQMVTDNPARKVRLEQPKRLLLPRLIPLEEIEWLKEASLKEEYQGLLNGALSTVVRLGLYGGLRDIEMAWMTWDWIDWSHGLLDVQKTTCQLNGEAWVPKSHEARRLRFTAQFLEFLNQEKERQQGAGLFNQFVIPAGSSTSFGCKLSWDQVQALRQRYSQGEGRNQLARAFEISWNMVDDIVQDRKWKEPPSNPYLGKPTAQGAPNRALHKMMKAEGRVKMVDGKERADITVHSLRRTYITRLLLPKKYGGAEKPPRFVQQRAGHKDLEAMELDDDDLPY